MSNLALNLVATATRVPHRTAAITGEQTTTYAELKSASARLATLLQREGIGVGDRVGVMLPNVAAAPIAYYVIWRMGAIAVPISPLVQGREVALYLSRDDVVLACLPLFHVFGMTCAMNAAIAAGRGLSLMARFDPATAIERIHRDRVTVLLAVPTMYSAVAEDLRQFVRGRVGAYKYPRRSGSWTAFPPARAESCFAAKYYHHQPRRHSRPW